MTFSDQEIDYIRSHPLARVATVSSDGQPDIVPIVIEFDGRHFFIGGYEPGRTRRAKNVGSGNRHVAFVIDDLASTDPWSPRYLRVYGDAELVERDAGDGLKTVMRISPRISWSFNLAGEALDLRSGPKIRRTEHDQDPDGAP